MATSFNPVGIAFANAGQARADLDRFRQDQNQALGQVLAVAGQQDQRVNTAQSLAQRNADRMQQAQQFDVVQNLRERQFGLDQMQSFAQMAAMKSGQELQALKIAQATQEINTAPMRQAAGMKLNSILGSVQTPEQLSAAVKLIEKDPEINQFLPYNAVADSIVQTRQTTANTQLQRTLANQQAQDTEDINRLATLGGNPKNYLDQDGNPDMVAVRNEIGRVTRMMESDKLNAQTAAQKDIINTRSQASVDAYRQKYNEISSKMSDIDKRTWDAAEREAFGKDALFNPEGADRAKQTLNSIRLKYDGTTTDSRISNQDQQALDWANANPQDPRAAQIKKRLGQ